MRHPLLGPTERLDVWSAPDVDGTRLVLEFSGGRRHVHKLADEEALTRETARVRAELLRDGWEPHLTAS